MRIPFESFFPGNCAQIRLTAFVSHCVRFAPRSSHTVPVSPRRFIAAENEYNIYVLRKNTDAMAAEDQKRLDVTGLFHVGDLINCMRAGSLAMRLPEAGAAGDAQATVLFATISGMVGVVASISQPTYALLRRVQDNLTHIIKGVGGFEHSAYGRVKAGWGGRAGGLNAGAGGLRRGRE